MNANLYLLMSWAFWAYLDSQSIPINWLISEETGTWSKGVLQNFGLLLCLVPEKRKRSFKEISSATQRNETLNQ